MQKNQLLKIAEACKAAYLKDRANVYRLESDIAFFIKLRTPEYDGVFWTFAPAASPDEPLTLVTLKAYAGHTADGIVICDGASLAPDSPTGVLEGAALHDPGYLELYRIADAWKEELFVPGKNFRRDFIARLSARASTTWTQADVRLLFDTIFENAMRLSGASSFIRRLYYSAVRACGGVFHRFFGASLCLLLALTVFGAAGTGCSGCAAQDIVEPDGWEPPPIVQLAAASNLTPGATVTLLEAP